MIDLAAFERDGFLVLPGFVPVGECEALKERAAELAATWRPTHERTAFSTRDQAHAGDVYFRESGGAIRFFAEEEAPDRLNKIGHALHDLDPVFDRFSRHPRFATLAQELGFRRPLLLQSMLILKHAEVGGEVSWHQDASFLRTVPSTVTGFWIALDDADRDNGCLIALPGGHRGPLRQWFGYEGNRLVMRQLDTSPWPDVEPVALEAPRGTLVVLHGLLPHASAPNRSPRSRQAYALHLIDGAARYEADNWLQRPGLELRGFA